MQRLLELIFDASDAGIAVVREPEFVFERVNAAFRKLASHREYLSRRWCDVYDDVVDADVMALLRGVYETGASRTRTEVELRIVGADQAGETRYYNISYDRLDRDARGAFGILIQAHDVTADVLKRRALQSQAAAQVSAMNRMTEILRSMPISVALFEGPDHRYTFVNEMHASFFGGRRDFVGRTVRAAVPEVASSHFVTVMDEVYRTGKTLSLSDYPLTLVQQDGVPRQIFFNLAFQALRAHDGEIYGLIVTAIDVTDSVGSRNELIQKNAKLTETQHLLSTATEVARVGFFDWDVQNDVFLLSDQFCRDWGVASGASVKDLFALIVPEDRASMRAVMDKAARDGLPMHVQYRVRRATDGAVIWIDAQGRVTKDQLGRPKKFFGTSIDITERKELESETIAMVNSIPQLAWMGDARGHLFWYNQVWQDFTGVDQEGMKRLGWAPFHHPDHLERASKKWFEYIEAGLPWEDIFPLRGKDGSYRTFLSRATPVRDLSGRIVKWFGTNTDITDTVRANEELAKTSRELRKVTRNLESAIEVAQIGFWSVDPVTRALTVDDRFLEHFGLERAQLTGSLDAGLKHIHAEDRPRVTTAVREAMGQGKPYHIEYRVIYPDGSLHWVEARGALTTDENGEQMFMGSTADTTQRKTTEINLAVERAQLDEIFEKSPAAMATWIGPDLIFDRVNADYQKLFPDRELVGRRLVDACPELVPQGFDRLLLEVMRTGEPYVGQEVLVKIESGSGKGAKDHYFNFSYIPMYDEAGRVFAVYAHAIDVTEAVLSRRMVDEARSAAEAANRAKSQFLANMSHEIRTPLGAIMGFSDLLQSPAVSHDEIVNYVNVIDRNSKHLLRIVDDILDLSKVEAGMLVIEEIGFSLLDLLADFASLMRLKAREKGIHFDLRFETNVPDVVLSDPTRLRQILTNVVSNAIKFTSRGHVQLTVGFVHRELKFRFTDTGIGMTPAQVARLFVPFQQADSTTTRNFGGTGLGLVLTRRLCEAMNGTFDLQKTKIDVGSTFVATIRVRVPESAALIDPQTPRTPAPPGARPSADKTLDRLRILLIEDSPDNQILINLMLSRQGARVKIANDGVEGVDLALGHDFDVVLCDMQMPRMDGYEAVGELRKRGYDVPIIALTAHAMKEEYAKAMSAGFTDYLTKPVQKDDLIATIRRNSTSVM